VEKPARIVGSDIGLGVVIPSLPSSHPTTPPTNASMRNGINSVFNLVIAPPRLSSILVHMIDGSKRESLEMVQRYTRSVAF
jgi:hypothetical protein